MTPTLRLTSASLIALALAATPAAAQDARSDLESWADRFSETLDNLVDQLGPKLQEAEEFFDVLGQIDDVGHYHSPEILPNGDILMRRRDDAPDWSPAPDAAPEDALPYDPEAGLDL